MRPSNTTKTTALAKDYRFLKIDHKRKMTHKITSIMETKFNNTSENT